MTKRLIVFLVSSAVKYSCIEWFDSECFFDLTAVARGVFCFHLRTALYLDRLNQNALLPWLGLVDARKSSVGSDVFAVGLHRGDVTSELELENLGSSYISLCCSQDYTLLLAACPCEVRREIGIHKFG